METKVAKWGNSLGVRLPKTLVEETNLKPGDRMTIVVNRGGKIVLAPKRSRIGLDELLREMRSARKRDEVDWGKARGRESW
jgi:antitoxin MazE